MTRRGKRESSRVKIDPCTKKQTNEGAARAKRGAGCATERSRKRTVREKESAVERWRGRLDRLCMECAVHRVMTCLTM